MKPASVINQNARKPDRINSSLSLIFAILVILIYPLGSAMAATAGDGAVLSVEIFNPLGDPALLVQKSTLAQYSFAGAIEINTGGPNINADLYFGVFSTSGGTALSWVKTDNGAVMKPGMSPISKGINMHNPADISVRNIVGSDITYKFTGEEKSGMYLVFLLLVTANADPAIPENWLAVRMEPLVVQ